MDVKLATQVGRPYDAAAVAEDVRTLWNIGRFSDVRAETEEDEDGVDVIFHVVKEPRYSIHEIRFEPHPFGLQVTVEPGTIMTRAQAAQSAANAREQLIQKGYADAKVDWRFAPTTHGEYDLLIKLEPGNQGRRHKDPPLPSAPKAMCESLFEERREAEYKGILDFNVSLDESGVPVIEKGKPYTLGRLTFYGHHHYSDALIRSHFQIDEGDPLDLFRLRQSVVRLNQAALFEPVDERQVHIATNEKTGVANVTINLTERKRHAWSFSGPVPVAASITGKIISTYGLSFHLLAFDTILKLTANKRLLPVLSLDRAFTPAEGWKSGLMFAPQLGWRGTVFSYASVQLQQRLLPKLAGTRAPDLAVQSGDKTLLCRYPKLRFSTVRIGASFVVRFATTFSGL